MNFKKTLIVAALIFASTVSHAAVFSTNIANPGTFLLFTNRASVYNIEITCTANALVNFYDCDSLAAPFFGTNYTNASYVSRTTYSTNYVTSFVGYNGFTNWYTNAGVWTLTSTNAANTNALTPAFSVSSAANTYTTVNTDAVFARGVSVVVTGTNVSLVVNYRSAQ